MSKPKRGVRQERAQATRSRILDVAVQLFAAKPYAEVSALEITREAGVAEGLLYHHFGTKRGIYLEAVREVSRELFQLDVASSSGPPHVQIRQMLHQHFSRLAEHGDLLIRYVRGSMAMAADSEAWDAFEDIRMQMVRWTCELVGLDMSSSPALRLMMRTAGDVLDRLSVRWFESGQPFEVDAMVETMVRVIIEFFDHSRSLDDTLDTGHVAALLAPVSGRMQPATTD